MSRKRKRPADESLEERLRAHLAHADYRPVNQRELLHELHLEPDEREMARRIVTRGLEQGWLSKLTRGRLSLTSSREVVGILRRHARGDGWIEPDGRGEPIRLPGSDLKGTLTGDRVRVRRGHGWRRARLVAVEEARDRTVTAVVERRGRSFRARPFADRIGPLSLEGRDRDGAPDGEVVLVQVLSTPEPGRTGQGRVVERWGPLDDPTVPIRIAARRYGLRQTFERPIRKAAKALPARVGRRQRAERERFDDPPPVTIDGETAKDFDDAIAVEPLGRGRFRLFVHIADVGAFVPPGSELDEEARTRGTSVYFPDRVLPMFPPELSEDLCSLRPGVDRLVRTAIVDVGADGEPGRVRLAAGVIRSAARLTYGQVGDWIEKGARDRSVPSRLHDMLEAADRLRLVLEARRKKKGSLDFDLPRPVLLLDVEGVVTGVRIETRNVAHRMIEQFMLLANEAVAAQLREKKLPTLYRVHDSPSAEGLDELERTASALGLRWRRPRSGLRPGNLAALFRQTDDPLQREALRTLVLRAMQPARYSTLCTGHFALASPAYCHFTSPIRRYPDLVVHRAVAAAAEGRAPAAPPDEALGRHCSERERAAERAEREVLRWRQIDYVSSLDRRRFEAVITGVEPFGLFAQLDEIGVDGLIRCESLGGERFHHDPAHRRLVSPSGLEFRLGQRLVVDIVRIDRVRRRLDLAPAS